MNLTLNLRPDLEDRLREKAAQDGVKPEAYNLALLEDQLSQRPPAEMSESELLLEAARLAGNRLATLSRTNSAASRSRKSSAKTTTVSCWN